MQTRKLWLLVLVAVFLVNCGENPLTPVVTESPAKIETAVASPVLALGPDVSVDMVADLVAREQVVVIDVREDFEFDAGHIPGALWLPLGELADRTDEVPTDATVILACRSGNRSSQAYQFLIKQGFENVHNMTGGMNAWTASGLEVEK